jgi:hypothetical protein
MEDSGGQGTAEKQCSVRHAPAMQLIAVANAVADAIIIVLLYPLSLSLPLPPYSCLAYREKGEGEEDRNPIQPRQLVPPLP